MTRRPPLLAAHDLFRNTAACTQLETAGNTCTVMRAALCICMTVITHQAFLHTLAVQLTAR